MQPRILEIKSLPNYPLPRSLPKLEDIVFSPEERKSGLGIEVARRHVQIQIALVKIGRQLGFRTWVAQNDKGIIYENRRLGEMESVIATLKDVKLLAAFEDAIRAALMIDCIWFQNSKLMPAVIEIEHSTGVTSGLTRMQGFQKALPKFPTRWVIAAPDEDRDKVINECTRPQFSSLEARFFSYSAIEELYSLCERRKVKGVTEEFLDCFMERCLSAIGN